MEIGGGPGGHEGEEVIDQVLGAAANDLEQCLGFAHLPGHMPSETSMSSLVRLACTPIKACQKKF